MSVDDKITLEIIQRVLEAANEVGPLPAWTQDEHEAADVLGQIQQEQMDREAGLR